MSKIGNSWVSYYLNNIVTLRNEDWNELQEHFYIPAKIEDIDQREIVLKNKVTIQVPLKNNLSGNDIHKQTDLFSSNEIKYACASK